MRGRFLLPILVDVAIASEFDGASSSLQRALNDIVPDLIGHCCDVQIHEKLRDALINCFMANSAIKKKT